MKARKKQLTKVNIPAPANLPVNDDLVFFRRIALIFHILMLLGVVAFCIWFFL